MDNNIQESRMMNKTKNYKLNKPEVTDYYNIEDFNNNSEIIDNELFKKIDKIEATKNNIILAGSAGSLADSGVAIDSVSKKISNPIKNNILAVDPTGEKINSGVHISELTDGLVPSEVGYGGLRYVDKDLQAFINNKWETIFRKTQTRIAFEDNFNRSGEIGNGWTTFKHQLGGYINSGWADAQIMLSDGHLAARAFSYKGYWVTAAIGVQLKKKLKLPVKLKIKYYTENNTRPFGIGVNSSPNSFYNRSWTGIQLDSQHLNFKNKGVNVNTVNIPIQNHHWHSLEIEFNFNKIKAKIDNSEHEFQYEYEYEDDTLIIYFNAFCPNDGDSWYRVDDLIVEETLF